MMWIAGLPEEKRIVAAAVARGYVVAAFSSQDRSGSRCWDVALPPDTTPDFKKVQVPAEISTSALSHSRRRNCAPSDLLCTMLSNFVFESGVEKQFVWIAPPAIVPARFRCAAA